MLTELQYRLARWIAPGEPGVMTGAAYAGKSKIAQLLGPDIFERVAGRDVIDFGCGEGAEAVELAQHGARVVGIDIQERLLARARARAESAGVADRCRFGTKPEAPADVIISLDSFEHFADPAGILEIMHSMLRPGGAVFASFGPTWYHPLGGHMFSIFPWAHILLAEQALIRWRSHLRSDGATRFEEVAGGLNRMTIARFERLAAQSPLVLEKLEPVPIRRLAPLHNRLTREWTTAIVRATLRRPA